MSCDQMIDTAFFIAIMSNLMVIFGFSIISNEKNIFKNMLIAAIIMSSIWFIFLFYIYK